MDAIAYFRRGTTAQIDDAASTHDRLLFYDTTIGSFGGCLDANVPATTKRFMLTLDSAYNVITNGATGIGNILFKDEAYLGWGAARLTMNDDAIDNLVLTGAYLRIDYELATEVVGLRLYNTDVPATGETTQAVSLGFYLYGTADEGGTSYSALAGKIKVGKDADWFTASGYADTDSNMQFRVSQASAEKEVMRITSDLHLIVGGNGALTAADSLIHIWTGSAGSVTALAGTMLTLEIGPTSYEVQHNYISFLMTNPGEDTARCQGLIFGVGANNNVASIYHSRVNGTDTLAFTCGGTVYIDGGTFFIPSIRTDLITSTDHSGAPHSHIEMLGGQVKLGVYKNTGGDEYNLTLEAEAAGTDVDNRYGIFFANHVESGGANIDYSFAFYFPSGTEFLSDDAPAGSVHKYILVKYDTDTYKIDMLKIS